MKYMRLYKVDMKKDKVVADYGWLSEKDIKAETRGYKHDKKMGVYTRKNSRYGFYTLGER